MQLSYNTRPPDFDYSITMKAKRESRFRAAVILVALVLVNVTVGAQSSLDSTIRLKHVAFENLLNSRWQLAADNYTELTKDNPYDGALWTNLGLSRLRLGEYNLAVQAFQKALTNGWSPATCYYNTACTYALAGDKRDALNAFEEAYRRGYINDHQVREDPDLFSLHDDPRFREIAGWPNGAITDRREQWICDLDFLARRLREAHWRPFHRITESQFETQVERIRQSIEQSTDDQLWLAVQALLVSIGDGHTTIVSDYFLHRHGEVGYDLKFLPIGLFWFDDGVRIVETTDSLRRFLGSRVVAIGDTTVEQVIKVVDTYTSRDNDWGARWGIANALTDVRLLTRLGLGDRNRGIQYTLEMGDGTTCSVIFPPGGLDVLKRITLAETSGQPVAPSYKAKEKRLFLAPIKSTLYVRIDAITDTPEESFAEFTERIFRTGDSVGAKRLVLDLRDNPGGSGHLARDLLHRLIASPKFNVPGSLYVLVGRKTFSAAMALAAQLEFHTAARFVGEPTGSRPNFVGESSIIRLPYSDLHISISSRYHQNGASNDERLWIAPDIPAGPTFEDMQGGRDRALELVLY
jgi:hypothetical protein